MARYNPNKAKIHRSYTFDELAKVYGVHKNTVAIWVKNGLPCIKDQRPFLLLGKDVRCYLQERRQHKKRRCNPDEMYCMRCRLPALPAEKYVEYQAVSATKGRLTGICCRCESIVNKFVSASSLPRYCQIFDITLPKDEEHISESAKPLVNSDFNL